MDEPGTDHELTDRARALNDIYRRYGDPPARQLDLFLWGNVYAARIAAFWRRVAQEASTAERAMIVYAIVERVDVDLEQRQIVSFSVRREFAGLVPEQYKRERPA